MEVCDTGDPVLLERKDAVGYLTLNRPEAGNAFDASLAGRLLERVIEAEANPAIRCIVVGGKGRMFCAGGDVKALHAAGERIPEVLEGILVGLHPAIARLATTEKPVITAIHGPAAGAGLGLAVVGDFALAGPDAHFTTAYSRIGLSPDGGATWLLPRLVGHRRAQELALTSRRVSAEEAAAIGLITRVVTQERLAEEVEGLAKSLAASALGAFGRTKRLLLRNGSSTLEEQLEAECTNILAQGRAAESVEGVAAFIERRHPDFTSAGR